jgi:putative ABC transport system permease protein
MEGFLKDLAHSIRMFRRSPGFTIAAVAALTLGIGTNTAIFTIVNAVLLKPVPFPDPDRLVMLMVTSPQGSGSWASPARFAHWRTQTGVLQEISAFRSGLVNLTGGDRPEQLRAGQVSADFFRLFGAPIIQGRSFSSDEDRPNGDKVVVLSHGLWTRRFGSDPHVIGRTISLSGDPHVVVGIVGPSFNVTEFGDQPELWTAFQLDPDSSDQGNFFAVAGRLRPGVTLDQAKARLQLSASEFRTKFPNALGPKSGFSVTTFQEAFVKDVRGSLLVLVGAVSFVLLIACANVANLLLVRATARKREIAIRSAVGASRGRIVRQLLAESVVLSLAGGALGLVLGIAAIRALLAVNTANIPRLGEHGSAVGLDWPVDAFVFGDEVGRPVTTFKKAWQVTLLNASGCAPEWTKGRLTDACRQRLAEIDLHFHDLRHEAGSRWAEGGMPLHHVKELLGHANIKTTDTYLNATRLGLQESMRKYEEVRKTCTKVAQTWAEPADVEEKSDPVTESEVEVPPGFMNGGVDGTRTRGLRRDRPAF